jgi:outer membrane protein assembly factor BamB
LGGSKPTNYFQFVVLCLDRATGNTLWQQVVREELPHEGHHGDHGYASGSPTTDGEFLYASFGSRGVYCLTLDGQVRWERDFGDMRTRNGFGEGTSPTLVGDTLIVNWDHEAEDFIAALDAKTGETKWQVERDEPTGWSTPLAIPHDGKTQIVVNGTNRARGYDLASGELLWECGGQTTNAIPSPVTADGVVYCVSGFRGSAAVAISLDSRGDLTETDNQVWTHSGGTPYVPSPLLYGDLLYLNKSNDAILTVLNAKTGEVVIEKERLPGLKGIYASPVGAAGRVYYIGRNGAAVVLKHGTAFEVLAENTLDDPIDASPAIVGKELYLRGKEHLYCIAEPQAQ